MDIKPLEQIEQILPLVELDIGERKRRIHEVGRASESDFVYTPYIHKNGKIIWHPRGGVYKFPRYVKN